MQAAAIGSGIVLLVILLADMLQTTLGDGGGWLTERIGSRLWRVVLRITSRMRDRHRFLSWAGTTVVLSILGTWIILLWGGWSLIFTASISSLSLWDTGVPAGVLNTIYFAGSSVFTLGLGDYVSSEPIWQILTVAAAFSGLFVATLAITYLTPAMQEATRKHALAIHISSLGRSSVDMLRRMSNGSDWSSLEHHLMGLTGEIARLDQGYLAYPVIHYVHARKRVGSAAVALASLDDALTILECGMPEEESINPSVVLPVRDAVSTLLGTLDAAFIPPAEHDPPLPSLEPLRDAGFPVLTQAEFADNAARLADRRRLLLGFVENEGRTWMAGDER